MKKRILDTLRGGLTASCQPVDDGPLDHPEIVAALAAATLNGGASGVRIEGIENVRATRARISAPIIGIVKEHLGYSPVRITPRIIQVRALAEAGADIIAYDGTDRIRPDTREAILNEILLTGKIAMADCASLEDGKIAIEGGAQILGTTLSGYTEETRTDGDAPDYALVENFKNLGAFVMAEGRYNTPELAAQAMVHGADAVTVGTALTRLEVMTRSFVEAIKAS